MKAEIPIKAGVADAIGRNLCKAPFGFAQRFRCAQKFGPWHADDILLSQSLVRVYPQQEEARWKQI
jgi:hypothetical protein